MDLAFQSIQQTTDKSTQEKVLWGITFLTAKRAALLGVLFLFGIALYVSMHMAQAAPGDITETGCIGACEKSMGNPEGLAVDSSGNIWVADSDRNQVLKYSPDGVLLKTLGNSELDSYGYPSYGSGQGEFNSPNGVAIDSLNNVYVLDKYNYRVQKFDSNGVFQSAFGSYGSGENQMSSGVTGIAVDTNGNIYVSDSYNNRVQKFNSSGNQTAEYTNNGESFSPYGVVVDSYGSILVLNGSSTIEKFNSYGSHVDHVSGDWNSTSIATFQGYTYLNDANTNSIGKYGFGGSALKTFGSYGDGPGQFDQGPNGIAVDSSGNVYATYSGYWGSKIEKFSSNGSYLKTIGKHENNFDFRRSGVTFDSYGNLYVADSDNSIVRKYGPDNKESLRLGEFGSYGSYSNQFDQPSDIATDSSGNIYVADMNNSRVQIFDSSGNYFATMDGSDTPLGYFGAVLDVKIDSSGNIYILDEGHDQHIYKYNSSRVFQRIIGTPGEGQGEYNFGVALAIDSNDKVYVASTYSNRIVIYSKTGTYLGYVGTPSLKTPGDFEGENPVDQLGKLFLPYDVLIDSQNNVWVVDSGNYRVQKFDSNYNYVSSWSIADSTYLDGNDSMPISLAIYQNKIALADASGSIVFLQEDQTGQTTSTSSPGSSSSSPGNSSTTTPDSSVTTTSPDSSVTTTPSSGIDVDNDGIDDSVESNGPNNGDGNNDGIKDSQQSNVLTFVSPSTSKYVTLVVPSGVTLSEVSGKSANSLPQSDKEFSYPGGLVSFKAHTEPGATINVTVIFHGVEKTSDMVVRKAKVNGDSVTFKTISGATLTQSTLDGKSIVSATYQLTDGGDLDDDGSVNGVIVDPVGLATSSQDAPKGVTAGSALPFTGSSSTSIVVTGLWILALGGVIAFVMRRRRNRITR